MRNKLLVLCILLCVGCAKIHIISEPIVENAKPPIEEVIEEVKVEKVEEVESIEIELSKVYFDFDKHDLKPAARNKLKVNAEALKRVPSVKIFIEGHCDLRGTDEYNIALGQKRADAVARYYRSVGIKNKIQTISYGEERPVISNIYWMNRRAVTNIE